MQSAVRWEGFTTFVRLTSFALQGVEALPVSVEVDVSSGLPSFEVVGLPDAAVRESRERVRAAVRNGGWQFPPQRITVNLAPAYTRKAGAGLDLAIALGVLAAAGHLPEDALEGLAVSGELALDGTLRPVRGALVMAMAAREVGCRVLMVPAENGGEAALGGHPVLPAHHLREVVGYLRGDEALQACEPAGSGFCGLTVEGPDLTDVKGQVVARRALEIAAAGGHNLFMVGPPGAGKSLLAKSLPGILPRLTEAEALEVSRIYSAAGALQGDQLVSRRPFRAPHHSASRSALLGGGSPLRPGEVTLAHRGVLFLDELPEFGRDALEGLRQPLEEGRVSLSRAQGTAIFPAAHMLVAAANPCPCGYYGDSRRECTCPAGTVTMYRSRLSGPLLDRFDLQIAVAPVSFDEIAGGSAAAEGSAAVRDRVEAARRRQERRLQGSRALCNAEMSLPQIRRHCPLPSGGEEIMRQALQRMRLSLRAYDRILKMARTIADLADSERVETRHLAEAIQYRMLDRGL